MDRLSSDAGNQNDFLVFLCQNITCLKMKYVMIRNVKCETKQGKMWNLVSLSFGVLVLIYYLFLYYFFSSTSWLSIADILSNILTMIILGFSLCRTTERKNNQKSNPSLKIKMVPKPILYYAPIVRWSLKYGSEPISEKKKIKVLPER